MNSRDLPISPLPQRIDIMPLQETADQVDAHIKQLSSDLRAARATLRSARVATLLVVTRLLYLRSADRLRFVVSRTVGLRVGAALIVGTVVGGLVVIGTRSAAATTVAAVLATLFSLVVLYLPADALLPQAARDASTRQAALAAQCSQCQVHATFLSSQVDAARARLAALQREIRNAEEINSAQLRRERLVAVNWKAMRGPDLEAFLAAVFAELGYVVELIGATGDQGVDLIVTKGGLRVAVQSKGYVDSVSNGAVQEVFAGMTYHSCQACAVITNSRFTTAATELAQRTKCILVDEHLLPALIRGEIDLLRRFLSLN